MQILQIFLKLLIKHTKYFLLRELLQYICQEIRHTVLDLKSSCMPNKYGVREDYQNSSSFSDLTSLLVLQKTHVTN